MRTSLVASICLALVSCDDDKPAGRPTADSDSLWKLAPEGTIRGIVVSPYGVGMLDGGVTTLKAFFAKSGDELAPLSGQLDGLLGGLGPFKDFSLAKMQLVATKGFALFFAKEGTVAVLPIADRDAFLKTREGSTKAATPDGIDKLGDQAFCKQLDKHYVCASTEAHLATVGKSAIGDRIKKLGARGDLEVVATELPLQGEGMPRSSFAAAFTLERGTWVVRGVLGNAPEGLRTKLATPARARTTIGKSAGFAMFDVRQLLDTEDKIVEGVTQKQLAASISGPATLDVPAGTRVLDVKIPLSNPKPMQDVIAKCNTVRLFQALGAKVENGVCKLDSPQVGVALDLWIEDNAFRIGKKGVPVTGVAVPMPKAAMELATGEWGVSFWGRGTMLAKQEKETPNDLTGVDPAMGTQTRVLSMLNEFGFGMKKDKEDVKFLLTMRTGFANPQAVVDKLMEISGKDVLANTASGKAAPIAEAAKTSPFGGDFLAGQHGMLIPTQMLDTGINLVIPAIVMFARGNTPPAPPKPEGPQQPPPPGAMTARLVKAYATLGYQAWTAKNPDKPCPPSVDHFAASVAESGAIPTKDEWGTELVIKCGKDLPAGVKDIAVISAGPDKKIGTDDDVKSY